MRNCGDWRSSLSTSSTSGATTMIAGKMSCSIARGFYADGIWADGGFMPYRQIGAISWREGKDVTLLVTARRAST